VFQDARGDSDGNTTRHCGGRPSKGCCLLTAAEESPLRHTEEERGLDPGPRKRDLVDIGKERPAKTAVASLALVLIAVIVGSSWESIGGNVLNNLLQVSVVRTAGKGLQFCEFPTRANNPDSVRAIAEQLAGNSGLSSAVKRADVNIVRAYMILGEKGRAADHLMRGNSMLASDPIASYLSLDLPGQSATVVQPDGWQRPTTIFLWRAFCFWGLGDSAAMSREAKRFYTAPRSDTSETVLRTAADFYIAVFSSCGKQAQQCRAELGYLETQIDAYFDRVTRANAPATASEAWFQRGRAKAVLGFLPDAITSFRNAVALNDMTVRYRIHLGAALGSDGQFEPAVRELSTAVALSKDPPDQAWALGELGYLYLNRGDYLQAKSYFARSIDKSTQDLSYSVGFAIAHLKSGEYAASQQLLERVLTREPARALAWLQLGFVRQKQGDGEGALQAFRRAVQLEPSSVEYGLILVQSLIDLGARGEARSELDRILKLAPAEPRAQSMLKMLQNEEQP
jgi:tetratricopeptide (TPR) repeat protein